MKIFSELSLCLGLILAIAPWIHAQDIPWDDVGKTGSDLADLATRDASDLTNTPAGSIAATDAQAAINELDTEKATTAQGALADSATQPGDNVSTLTNDSGYLTTALANPQFAARSPDSGIVFSGTNASKGLATAVALGTGDWYLRAKIRVPTSDPSAIRNIIGLSSDGVTASSAVTGDAILGFNTTGQLYVAAGSSGGAVSAVGTDIVATYPGAVLDLVMVRVADTVAVYINGLADSMTESGAGTWDAASSGYALLAAASASNTLATTILAAEYGNVALTAAEVLTLHRFGWAALPQYLLAAGAQADVIAGWDLTSGWQALVGGTIDDANSFTSASYGDGVYLNNPSWLVRGKEYLITYDFTSTGPSVQIMFGNSQNLVTGLVGAVRVVSDKSDSFRLRILGAGTVDINTLTVAAIGVAGSWDFSTGAGYQQRDLSGGKRPMTLSTTGLQRLRPDRQGEVTGSLTWADTHEVKSLLGQEALPANAIIDAITFVATAGSTGDGITIGTTTDPDQFVTVNTYTTTAENFAGSQLTSPFPGGTATNDLTIVVDPDTANYTGSITTTVTYHLANY